MRPRQPAANGERLQQHGAALKHGDGSKWVAQAVAEGMSRAFVKEDSDAPPPPPRPRRISDAPNLVTERGAELIERTVARLEADLADADDTDRPLIERDLDYWRVRKSSMRIMPAPDAPDTVAFGITVTLSRGGRRERLRIVGEDEAEPRSGRIAWTSPLARAIDGLEVGDVTQFVAGGKEQDLEILEIVNAPDA
ncbi:GreA/GreB family elongation factor [Stakelama saccharophila]|uniref:GreA/GreB family elongation factor n=1 Tax=Stakelama saccharophila TaxID=3075605 RepID=A0ABZ0B684_9SPHN|nr:GreA/GreB family elongation factor [Stakelama sp. W311]WNO52912.1 GreA/GreB family elongation factor [Stakelama sp. W311]